MRGWIATANATFGSNVQVSAVTIDWERFKLKKPSEDGADEWNAGIVAKQCMIADLISEYFPAAMRMWYARAFADGVQIPAKHFADDHPEPGEGWATSLYLPEFLEIHDDRFAAALEIAKKHGSRTVDPWISLASGYPDPNDDFEHDLEYDVMRSWALGRDLNYEPRDDPSNDRSDRTKAKHVGHPVFYPGVFDIRSPGWFKHCRAYALGAQNMPIP